MENTKKKIFSKVKSPAAHNARLRKGNGFSLSEIKAAGKSVALLKELKIKIDYFRKSAHKTNIEELKSLKALKEKGKKRKPYIPKEKRIKVKGKVKKKISPVKVAKVTPKKPLKIKKPIEKVVEEPIEQEPEKPIKEIMEEPMKEIVEKPVKEIKAKVKDIEKGIPLTELKGLGPTTAKKFNEIGVSNLEILSIEDPKELAMLLTGVSEDRIEKWIEEAKEVLKKKINNS
ncbi:MAG: helix-hairpin-helix domain-containing protein [Promethearchaeota archaeon]